MSGHAAGTGGEVRPAELCRRLLGAMDASEGRRKRRKRDTRPDAIGLGIKQDLLGRAAVDDPEAEEFEGWLLEQCLAAGPLAGATRAMAMEILDEWRLAIVAPSFGQWLEAGAPSDDARPGTDGGLDPR